MNDLKENTKNEIKGLWIPPDLLSDPSYTIAEMLILAYLMSFASNEIWQSNAEIARRTHTAAATVTVALKKFAERGRVKLRYKAAGGAGRRIYVLKQDPAEVEKFQNLPEDEFLETTPPPPPAKLGNHTACKAREGAEVGNYKAADEKAAEWGNERVNTAFEIWHEMTGYPAAPTASNRRAAWNMMRAKDKGEGWLRSMLKLLGECKKDRYAPAAAAGIASLADLQNRWEQLLGWATRKRLLLREDDHHPPEEREAEDVMKKWTI